MFGLFGKKGAGTPEDKLAECQKKKDWVGLVKAYYKLGVTAMEQGELNRAQLWLHRADTIYSAQDEIYDKVGDTVVDDCSERIGKLEEEDGLLYNTIPAQIEEKAEELGDAQIRVWGMMSIARLVKLGERLSRLPGCEVLGELGWAVDMMFNSLQTMPSQEEYQKLMDVCNALYELDGGPHFWCGEIDIPGKAPFQAFDLNGMMGVHLEINDYIDNHLRLLSALSQGAKDLPAAVSEVVGCTLLPDYYVRTGADDPEKVPQIQAELGRIWSDYDFVSSEFTLEQAGQRIAEYKQLDILA